MMVPDVTVKAGAEMVTRRPLRRSVTAKTGWDGLPVITDAAQRPPGDTMAYWKGRSRRLCAGASRERTSPDAAHGR
jgi:hypothetical protein